MKQRFVFNNCYIIIDDKKFALLTLSDAKELGRLEHRAMFRKWKQMIRRIRAVQELEQFLSRFGLRVATVSDNISR